MLVENILLLRKIMQVYCAVVACYLLFMIILFMIRSFLAQNQNVCVTYCVSLIYRFLTATAWAQHKGRVLFVNPTFPLYQPYYSI